MSNTNEFVMKSNSSMAATKTEMNSAVLNPVDVYHYMCSRSSSAVPDSPIKRFVSGTGLRPNPRVSH